MNWEYKNIEININEQGIFYFTINNKRYEENSLDKSKKIIDNILNEFYTFTKKDLDRLYNKLTSKEKCFIDDIITELNIHANSNYCELGLHNFEWDITDILF